MCFHRTNFEVKVEIDEIERTLLEEILLGEDLLPLNAKMEKKKERE
ncbi:MAG: hypothetical protein ACFFE5_03695 [Candidatus Thorarchaeota archaeon]